MSVERAPGVFEAGADIVSVVTDITLNADPESRLRQWIETTRAYAGHALEQTPWKGNANEKTVFAALFGLAFTAATAAHADDKLKLILDWYVNPDHGPIIVADKLGYFKDAGLEVDIVAPADASTPTKMVAAGQADLAISYQQQVHLQVHEGLPLIRVGTLIDSPLNCLMTRDDGSVNSIADLKGKRSAIRSPEPRKLCSAPFSVSTVSNSRMSN